MLVRARAARVRATVTQRAGDVARGASKATVVILSLVLGFAAFANYAVVCRKPLLDGGLITLRAPRRQMMARHAPRPDTSGLTCRKPPAADHRMAERAASRQEAAISRPKLGYVSGAARIRT